MLKNLNSDRDFKNDHIYLFVSDLFNCVCQIVSILNRGSFSCQIGLRHCNKGILYTITTTSEVIVS